MFKSKSKPEAPAKGATPAQPAAKPETQRGGVLPPEGVVVRLNEWPKDVRPEADRKA